jgi:hypothetical protein
MIWIVPYPVRSVLRHNLSKHRQDLKQKVPCHLGRVALFAAMLLSPLAYLGKNSVSHFFGCVRRCDFHTWDKVGVILLEAGHHAHNGREQFCGVGFKNSFRGMLRHGCGFICGELSPCTCVLDPSGAHMSYLCPGNIEQLQDTLKSLVGCGA